MKKVLAALPAAMSVLALLPSLSYAVEEGPESPLPFNVSLTSDYRYRGISQSRLKPALQGGYDYSHASGLYLGTWMSTIQWIKDAKGGADVEWDFYGGYKGEVVKDVGFDVGGLYYYYPSNHLNPSTNTFEVYGALSYGPFTAKYSHSTTNLFGFADSKGSGYLDLSASFDLGNGFTLAPHVGHQSVRHLNAASYTDYSLILGKDLAKGFNLSAALVGTDADKNAYVSPSGKFLGRNGVVVTVKFNF